MGKWYEKLADYSPVGLVVNALGGDAGGMFSDAVGGIGDFFGGDDAIDIPPYDKSKVSNFDLFGLTSKYDKKTNTYSASADPEELATMQAVKGIRNSLLKSLGIGGTPESDPYTQAYMQELLRTSQAPLENALIGRGLGGSTVYKDALTDLMTKAATQSVLGGQQYKLNNLSALSNYLNQNMNYGQNLLGLSQGNEGLMQGMYNSQLPYLASLNQGSDWSGLGGLLGTGLGALLALPTGGMSVMAGAGLGNMLGSGAGKFLNAF